MPDAYLRTFGKKFMKDMGFDVDKPKSGPESKIPEKRIDQIEQYLDEIDDNTKQFARELNELPTSEDNQDNIMLQDIINKNGIATDNSIKLMETSLTEIGGDRCGSIYSNWWSNTWRAPRSRQRIKNDKRFFRSAIAKSMAKQVDIDKEKQRIEEIANYETYSDEQREEVRARLQRFQDEQKAI